MEFAIYCKNLCRSFGEIQAVKSLTLGIKRGEIYGFLGPNGAGKTTSLRMLSTLLKPTSGEGWVAGHDISKEPELVRLKIGTTLQEASLDNILTGRETLTYQGRYYGLSQNQIQTRIDELAPLLDMDAIDRRVKTYSGGMKRRLDVAASLIHNPEVLFLDEPTTGLDPVSRIKVWEEIRQLNSNYNITIFLTTQYLDEADQLADRVGILSGGEILTEGSPEELKRKIGKDVICVRVGENGASGTSNGSGENGENNKSDRQELLDALGKVSGVSSVDEQPGELLIGAENGTAVLGEVAVILKGSSEDVIEISLRSPTLDEVFLEATGYRIKTHEDEPTSTEETQTVENLKN